MDSERISIYFSVQKAQNALLFSESVCLGTVWGLTKCFQNDVSNAETPKRFGFSKILSGFPLRFLPFYSGRPSAMCRKGGNKGPFPKGDRRWLPWSFCGRVQRSVERIGKKLGAASGKIIRPSRPYPMESQQNSALIHATLASP